MIDISQQSSVPARAIPTDVIADTRIRRWSAGLMADHRLACEFDGTHWVIAVDGRRVAKESSFEAAIHSAYAMTRALLALDRLQAA
jgi:hypothetical protein